MPNVSQLKTGISFIRWQVGNFLPKNKINPKAIGYVCPNGTINFQTTESAQTYAKNRVMSALHSPKPFERAVFVEDSQIIADVNGSAHNVHFDSKKILDGRKNVTLVHGHPSNTPLSDQDYCCLSDNKNLESIIAYNKKGELSKMTKEKEFYLIGMLLRNAMCTTSKMMFDEIIKKDFTILVKKIMFLKNKYKGMTIEQILLTNEGKQTEKFAKELLTKINNIWAKNENLFGINYECNFSKLG